MELHTKVNRVVLADHSKVMVVSNPAKVELELGSEVNKVG